MEWYLPVSHTHIIPLVDVVFDVVGPPDDVWLPSPDIDDQQRLQRIVVIIDGLVNLVNSCCDIFTRLSRAAHISHGGSI